MEVEATVTTVQDQKVDVRVSEFLKAIHRDYMKTMRKASLTASRIPP